jgi:hypothetical protein
MCCLSAAREPAVASTRAGLAGLRRPPAAALILGGAAVRPEDATQLDATCQDADLTRTVVRLRRLARS